MHKALQEMAFIQTCSPTISDMRCITVQVWCENVHIAYQVLLPHATQLTELTLRTALSLTCTYWMFSFLFVIYFPFNSKPRVHRPKHCSILLGCPLLPLQVNSCPPHTVIDSYLKLLSGHCQCPLNMYLWWRPAGGTSSLADIILLMSTPLSRMHYN